MGLFDLKLKPGKSVLNNEVLQIKSLAMRLMLNAKSTFKLLAYTESKLLKLD